MSRFKANPKKQNSYPSNLSHYEDQRKGFRGFKNPKTVNMRANAINAQMLQRFSGKRGK